MTIDEYAAWAAGVGGVSASPGDQKLSYLGLGLTGEAGEVAELIKKLLRDGNLDRDKLAEELGDVAYYWACLCIASGRQPSDVLAASRRKIAERVV